MSLSAEGKFKFGYALFCAILAAYIGAPLFSILNSDFQRGLPFIYRVQHVCQAKYICEKYADITRDCSVAHNIKQCINTRMSDDMYFMCSANGHSKWSDDKIEPNYLTCKLNQGVIWLDSYAKSRPSGSD